MSEAREQAFDLYRNGLTLKEIAEQLGVSSATIRSWKRRDRWDEKGSATQRKKEKKSATRKVQRVAHAAEALIGQQDTLEKSPTKDVLSDKQKLFCLHYVRCFNATKAYQKACGVSWETANAHAYEWMARPEIREEIERLKKNRINRELLSADDIVQKYIDIAFADITDYLSFDGRKLELRSSDEIDGTLIKEIRQTKEGISFRLIDRESALRWLADHYDLLTEEQRVRVDVAKANLPPSGEDMEDDGFLEALQGKAAEDWNEESAVQVQTVQQKAAADIELVDGNIPGSGI